MIVSALIFFHSSISDSLTFEHLANASSQVSKRSIFCTFFRDSWRAFAFSSSRFATSCKNPFFASAVISAARAVMAHLSSKCFRSFSKIPCIFALKASSISDSCSSTFSSSFSFRACAFSSASKSIAAPFSSACKPAVSRLRSSILSGIASVSDLSVRFFAAISRLYSSIDLPVRFASSASKSLLPLATSSHETSPAIRNSIARCTSAFCEVKYRGFVMNLKTSSGQMASIFSDQSFTDIGTSL